MEHHYNLNTPRRILSAYYPLHPMILQHSCTGGYDSALSCSDSIIIGEPSLASLRIYSATSVQKAVTFMCLNFTPPDL